MTERDPVIGLTASQARNAKIAYTKESKKRDIKPNNDILNELDRGFDKENQIEEIMRFRIPRNAAENLHSRISEHVKYRKDKQETAATKKYQSLASIIERQLIMQGVDVR